MRTAAGAGVTRMGDGTGWPVLHPAGRGWTRLVRIGVALIAAACVLQLVDVVIDVGQRPAWRWALIVAGGLVALTGSVRVWMLAGRMRRLVPDPARPRATARQYRAARTALRTGTVLTDLAAVAGMAVPQVPIRRLQGPAAWIGAVALGPGVAPEDGPGRDSR